MNIATFSPVLALLYVFILLWILMGMDVRSFRPIQRLVIVAVFLVLALSNQLLRDLLGPAVYGKRILFCLHLPTFFLFLCIAKRGAVKTAFMILTAIVFTAPTVLIGNLVRRTLFEGSPQALFLSNVISYALMLLLAHFVFRNSFTYLLAYGDTRFFLLFSLVPFAYYLYVLASVNLDLTSLSSVAGILVRFIPTILIFLFYFLLPYMYRSLRERLSMVSAQTALQHKLDSTREQISLLSETNASMAVYRHDVRHRLIVLDGLLAGGKTAQAQEFIKAAMSDLDAITPQKFCENETVNLLCSSYDSKARRTQVRFTVEARLPKSLPLSDTELCSVVANGLENALHAASRPEVTDKWVEFYGEVRQNKLFLQIRNSYAGRVVMDNGLPLSDRDGHGYGCRSIQSVAQHSAGLCSFEAEDGVFTLRVMIPLPAEV